MEEPIVSIYGDLGDGTQRAPVAHWKNCFVPRRVVRFLWEFATLWWISRYWFALLTGLPAAVGMITIAVLSVVHVQSTQNWSTQVLYETRLSQAVKEEKWNEAHVISSALLAKRPNEPKYLFQEAIIAERQEQMPRSLAILERLSPLEGIGYPPARRAMAQQLLKRGDTESAIRQLEMAVAEAPQEDSYLEDLGRLQVMTGQVAEGLEQLTRLKGDNPLLQMQMGVWYRGINKSVESERAFRGAATAFEKKWNSDRDPRHAALAIDGWRSIKELDRAESIAVAWHRLDPQYLPAREALANCVVDRANLITSKQYASQKWALLEKALTLSPNNLAALVNVSELAFAEDDVGEQASATIDRLLSSGQAPTVVHTILGTRAASEGNWHKAELHLGQAKAQNPNAPVILNNLAWVLASATPPKLVEAKLVVEEAIKLAPKIPDILDTYGYVELLSGNATKAITHLESALRLRPGHLPYRKRLAMAYREAGDDAAAKSIESLIEVEESNGKVR